MTGKAKKFSIGVVGPISAGTTAKLIQTLEQESEYWKPLFGLIDTLNSRFPKISDNYAHWISTVGADNFKAIEINQMTQWEKSWPLPPLSSSVVGRHLARVVEQGDAENALSILQGVWVLNGNINLKESFGRSSHPDHAQFLIRSNRGISQISTLQAMEAECPIQTSHQKLTADAKRVTERTTELDGLIDEFQTSSDHTKTAMVAAVTSQYEASEKAQEAAKRMTRLGAKTFKKNLEHWEGEFKSTHEKFVVQLKYKAPVELWEERAKGHRIRAISALVAFVFFLTAFCIGLVFLVFWNGELIVDTFTQQTCRTVDQAIICGPGFSYLGPLSVSTILLISSLSLWVLRMIHRSYLSESHLAKDASERKAFAQTYYALIEDDNVSTDQESIVLGALFKPTQDGLVKDDESGLDLSAIAILANRLNRPGTG